MPQIQVLPQNPGFGQQLGQNLGQGVSQGIADKLKNFHEEKNRLEKSRSALPNSFQKYQKSFGYESLSPDIKKNVYKRADDLIRQGYNDFDATQRAFNEYDQSLDTPEAEPKQSGKGIFNTPISELFSLNKLFAPHAEPERGEPRQNIAELLQKAEKQGIPEFRKALASLSNEEFMSLPREQRIALSKEIGGNIVPEEAARSFTKGLIPGVKALEKASGLGEGEFGTPQAKKTGEVLGNLVRDLGLFNVAGQAKTLGGRVGSAAGLFGGIKAIEKLAEGESPTLGEIGKEAAIGAGTELLAPVLGPIIKFIKSKFPSKALKSLPGVSKAASQTEAVEDVLKQSLKNVEEKGFTVSKINAGDPQASKALQQEVNKVSNLYKEADKMNLKELQKIRQETMKKLPESPLEKYYAPVKEVKHRPETIAKEELRVKPLESSIKQHERSLRNLQYEVLSTENAIRQGGHSAGELARLESKAQLDTLAHQRVLNEIKNLNFEIKYGRPPATTEEINKQIEKSFSELKEGLKNPTAEKVEAFNKAFERDKHAIDEAQKLVNRGDIPGPEIFDEYIKINQQYNKAYEGLISQLKDFIKENKGKARSAPKVSNAENLLKTVENAKKLSDAKLINHRDKRRAMLALEKPSGAFYKNMLRDLRKDVDAFQKDFFKWNQIASKPEAKIGEAANRALKTSTEAPKRLSSDAKEAVKNPTSENLKKIFEEIKATEESIKEAVKNPTSENVKKISEEIKATEESISEYFKRLKNLASQASKEIKSGTATVQTEKNLINDVLSAYQKLPKLKKILVSGLVSGSLQGISEEYFGVKPSISQINLAGTVLAEGNLSGGLGTALGAAPVGSFVSKQIHKMFDQAAIKELKSRRNNPSEYADYMKKLQKKYSTSRVNKIKKEALAS